MATFEALTDPYLASFTPVPLPGPGVCRFCRAQPNPPYERCRSCVATSRQVSAPLRLLVPISLYEGQSQLHLVLRRYKDGIDSVRATFAPQVAGLLGRFLAMHAECIADVAGAWDTVTVVPSAKRPAVHPFAKVVQMIGGVPELNGFEPRLLKVDKGLPAPRTAGDNAFAVTQPVGGRRVLLLDDTYTTGASLQSAASALARTGAVVVAGVVVGRFINPVYSPDVWAAARAQTFDFSRCGLEGCRGRG